MNIYEDLQKYTDFSLGRSKEVSELKYEDTIIDQISFVKYDLNNSIFVGVVFNECDFTNVYLSGSMFGGSEFNQCIFKNNIFKKGNADNVIFNNSKIEAIDTFKSTFQESTFHNIQIINSNMKSTLIANANIKNTIFKNTDLTDSVFDNCIFDNCIFDSCIFDNTKFIDIDLSQITFIDNQKIVNKDMKVLTNIQLIDNNIITFNSDK